MIITGQRLEEIGKALFGHWWKVELGHILERSRRMIDLYASGAQNLALGMRSRLASVCRERGEKLLQIANEIEPVRRL